MPCHLENADPNLYHTQPVEAVIAERGTRVH